MISFVDMEIEKNSMILEDEREQIYRALEKYDSHSQYFLPEEDLNTVNYLMTCLCDFLKADAEPVRHGKWIYHSDWADDGECPYECPYCGRSYDYSMNFCGFCGAKMDEVAE